MAFTRALSKIILSLSITSILICSPVEARPCWIIPCPVQNFKGTAEALRDAVEKFPTEFNVNTRHELNTSHEVKIALMS